MPDFNYPQFIVYFKEAGSDVKFTKYSLMVGNYDVFLVL
jgi:hypothetical protein